MSLRIIICFHILVFTGILGMPEKRERIYGGSLARITDYPYLASIRTFHTNQLICGGSIISKWMILTAAHCLYTYDPDFSNLRIYTGSADSVQISGNNYKVDYVKFHPYFNRLIVPQSVLRNDVALIKLHSFIIFDDFQKKINLPTRAPFTGNMAIIVGWGLFQNTYPNQMSAKLRKASVTLFHKNDCQRKVPLTIMDSQFCSIEVPGVGVCSGDAGGPVVSNGELYGIITYSFRCASGLPDIHTQVHHFLPFITHNLVE